MNFSGFNPSDLDNEDYEGMPDLCDKEKKEEDNVILDNSDIDEGQKVAPVLKAVDADGWEDILGSGRLKKRILREGDSSRGKPPRGASCTVHIIERLVTGEEVGTETELVFNVGESEVIQALDLVVPLMEVGEKAEVRLEATFGYGAGGDNRRQIPGGASIELELQLVEWEELGSAPDIERGRRMEIGERKRERGNKMFSRGEYSSAIQCYRKAAEYLDDKQIEDDLEVPIDRFLLPKDLQAMLEARVKTYNNMAQAQMKLTAWDSAFASIRQVLKIEPNNEKALFRKAKVLVEKCQIDEAIGILRRVGRLYPDNKECQAELARLTTKMRAGREKEQILSRKMLGLKDMSPIPSDKNTSLFSKQVKFTLAAFGGLGALAATYIMKYYNIY